MLPRFLFSSNLPCLSLIYPVYPSPRVARVRDESCCTAGVSTPCGTRLVPGASVSGSSIICNACPAQHFPLFVTVSYRMVVDRSIPRAESFSFHLISPARLSRLSSRLSPRLVWFGLGSGVAPQQPHHWREMRDEEDVGARGGNTGGPRKRLAGDEPAALTEKTKRLVGWSAPKKGWGRVINGRRTDRQTHRQRRG